MLADLKFVARSLLKTPGFTAIAVLTVALGIGATTTIFSVVNAVLLRPLAMQEPQRVVYLQERWKGMFDGFSAGDFADVRERNSTFSSLAASNGKSFTLL